MDYYFWKMIRIPHLVVNEEGAVTMLQRGVGVKDCIVRLYNSCSYLRGWVYWKPEFWFLAVVHGQSFHQQGSKARASSSSKGVKYKEPLKTTSLVSHPSDPINCHLYLLLPNSVMSTSVVVCRILLACDQLFRVEKLSVGACADLDITGKWLTKGTDEEPHL